MRPAVVALIIKDGLILSISRRHNKEIFGLVGGKVEVGETYEQALVREVEEETGIKITSCVQIYQRVEPGDGPNGEDFYSTTYYATNWTGSPTTMEEGEVKWLTAAELTTTKAAFGDYNRKMLDQFQQMFPEVRLKGEGSYTTGQEQLIQHIKSPPQEITSNKLFVVCDANGTCQGIFTDERLANQVADYVGAYVSEHSIDSIVQGYDEVWYQQFIEQGV